MSMINGAKLREIKERIKECKEDLSNDGNYEDMYHVLRRDLEALVKDAELMHHVIDEIREVVHYAEDYDVILGVAEMTGTNCKPGCDLDEES